MFSSPKLHTFLFQTVFSLPPIQTVAIFPAKKSYIRSGFTDFQAITFYNGTFANPGQTCGDLLATSMDLDGVLRFPSAGAATNLTNFK